MRKALFIVTIAVLLQSTAWATDLIINNARLIDGSGAKPRENVNIAIAQGHIVAVTRQAISADKHVRVIDAAGRTVMPGLAELHVHSSLQFLVPDDAMGGRGYPDPKWAITSDEKMQAYIDDAFPKRMKRFLETGVTTIVDPGAYFPWIITMRDRVRSGAVTGPNMYVTGRLFTAPGGHPALTVCNGHPWCVKHLTIGTDDPELARQAVRMLVNGGVDGLKLVYDGKRADGKSSGFGWRHPHLKPAVMQAIIDEGHKQGVSVLAHTFAIADTEEVVLAGIDGLVHGVTMERGSYQTASGETLPTLLNRHNVPMTTTMRFGISNAEELARLPLRRQKRLKPVVDNIGTSLQAMADAGVVLMFGTDFEGIGIKPQPRALIIDELHTLLDAGFSAMEVIQMATGNAAKHPLTPDNMGVIKPGNIADILILGEDPLHNIDAVTHPQIVILGGQVVIDS